MNDQLDHALDLIRRLPPQQVEKNLGDLISLAPKLEEDLLSSVDQPLKVARDKSTGQDYLLCDYNRDGDSYRSPWSNTYDPEIEDGTLPTEELRQLEIEANTAFAQYREMYYEGGVSSVYLWPIDEEKVSESFAGALLIKHQVDGSTKIKGCWDSIHLFEVKKSNDEKFHYKLTSSFILWLRTARKISGTIRIGGSITRQSTKDLSLDENGSHVGNLGSMVEEMENRIWNSFTSIYMGKTSYVVNSIRLAKAQEQRKPDVLTTDLVSNLNREKTIDEKPKPVPKPKPRVAPIPAVRSSKAAAEPKKNSLLLLEERKKSLQQEIQKLNGELKECQEVHSQNDAQLSSINEAIKKIMEQQGRIFDENGTSDKERNERIDSLRKLETIKHEKDLFHQKCKQEKKRMDREIKQYIRLSEEPEDEEDLDELEKELDKETNKLKEIKLELAAKNREVATFQRTLDDIPSRAELNQYQKRLVELYNQVASKHFETKKFYILYNQLEDTRIHLEKELSLLDSILNNFNHAMASPQTKDQFMSQFEQIVENIRQAQVKVDRIKQTERFRKDQLSENYKDLIEKKRSYYKAVRELKEEMRKNELLTAK